MAVFYSDEVSCGDSFGASMSLIPITHLMPVRNGEEFLAKSLRDIQEAIDCSDEILVINDGSNDSTAALLAEAQNSYGNLRVVTTNGVGLIGALRLGVELSKFDWIARWDVDDVYDLERMRVQRELITDGVAAIFSDYDFWIDGKISAGRVYSPIFPLATKLSLLYSQQTPHPAALINKKLLLQAGNYREDDYPAEDLGLWLRLSSIGKLVTVPQNLLHYRLSKESISARRREAILSKKNELISNKKNWNLENVDTELVREFLGFKELPDSKYRQLLFHRNLAKALKLDLLDLSKESKRQLGFGIRKIKFLLPVLKLYYFQLRRKIFRSA